MKFSDMVTYDRHVPSISQMVKLIDPGRIQSSLFYTCGQARVQHLCLFI